MNGKPALVITGASGFIGNHLVDYLKEDYTIFAIARRSRKEANIPYHANLHWLQCDITNWNTLAGAAEYIRKHGGVDYIIHLAAFYDFTYEFNPAYETINVNGTRNMLDFSIAVSAKRFLFASSLAACNFPQGNNVIDEQTPPDADYHYAVSKKLGENLVRDYSAQIPCSVVRFAAVFSDWCEFAPLYKFLSNWLSNKMDSRILGGKGESAIPYIHIKDLCRLLKIVCEKSESLPSFEIYNASPAGSTSHSEIFEIATNYYFGRSIKPFHIPKILAYPGLFLRNILTSLHLTGEEPFERYWMIRYIDQKLNIDSSATQKKLEWLPTPRYHLTRRLLFLLEKLKSHPVEWKVKNEAALKRVAGRVNLIIYDKMIEQKDVLLAKIKEEILENPRQLFTPFLQLEEKDLECYISTVYHLLMAAIRSSDRSLLLKYLDKIAIHKFAEGFEPASLCGTARIFSDVIINHLICYKELSKFRQEIYDYVGLSMQIAQDEIEDLYDELANESPSELIPKPAFKTSCRELQKMIIQLSAFYQVSPEDFNLSDEYLKNYMQ